MAGRGKGEAAALLVIPRIRPGCRAYGALDLFARVPSAHESVSQLALEMGCEVLARRSMPSYQPYSPEQAELLPAHVKDVLGADHLCFLVHEVVESLDLSGFQEEGEDEGGQRAYDPRLMLKVWLYGFGVNVRTTRKMEQRIREDLGFRYLAGGAAPDHKTLSEFHRRHRAAIADHFIVAQRVTQNKNDNRALVPMVDEVERRCGARPQRVMADCGFFSNENLRAMEARDIETYLPDPNLARELSTGDVAGGVGRMAVSDPSLQRLRQRLRTTEGRAWYKKRKALVEPVFGILKEQRGMRQFQRRGLSAVGTEWALAATAHNLFRYHALRRRN